MKETLKLVLVLTIICLAAGLLLAAVYEVTKDPIATAQMQKKLGAIQKVLPDYDNDPYGERITVSNAGEQAWTFYPAQQGEQPVGYAIEATVDGYGGEVLVMIGIDAERRVHGVEIIQAKHETPGLGGNIAKPKFTQRFNGKAADETAWCAVRKDQGEIDSVTGATISSRAVCEAVKAALIAWARDMLKADAEVADDTPREDA